MDDPFGRWLMVIILSFFTALISALQSALKAIPEEKAAPLGSRMLHYVQNTKYPLASLDGVRVLSVLWLGAMMAQLFQVPWWAKALIVLAGSLLLVPLCFILPNRLAKRHPDQTLKAFKSFLFGICIVTKPFAVVFIYLTDMILRLMGRDTQDKEEVTEEEIKAMVDIGEESGAIEQSEHEMITNVLEFTDMTAEECMTHRTDVTALWIEDDDETILKTIRETGLSRFPVYDEDIDDVIGILATRDYLLNARSSHPRKLRELLREPYLVPETVKTDVLLRNMQKVKTHIAIVVDEYGGVSGLVTMEDLLEEIVGNIYDEFDPADEAEYLAIAPDVWQVTGSADLDTLAEEMDVTIPNDEDFDTIGGMIFSKFTVIPDDGTTPELTLWCTKDGEKPEKTEGDDEELFCDVMQIKVEEISDRRIEKARITILRQQEVETEETAEAENEDDAENAPQNEDGEPAKKKKEKNHDKDSRKKNSVSAEAE